MYLQNYVYHPSSVFYKFSKLRSSGLYGHSAVYDPNKDVIYIHGGMAFKQSKFDVSRDTYVYDMEKKQAYFVHVRSNEQVFSCLHYTSFQVCKSL